MSVPRLIVHNSIELHTVNPNQILYIKSSGNYCDVHLVDGSVMQNLPVSLGQMAEQIRRQLADSSTPSYIQLGRQYIVNADHILSVYPQKKRLVFDVYNKSRSSRVTVSPSSPSLFALVKWLSSGIKEKSCSILVDESSSLSNISDEEIRVLNHT